MDVYAQLRASLCSATSAVLGVELPHEMFRCAPRGYGARCAAAHMLHGDAALWARTLNAHLDAYSLFNAPLVASIHENGGHLLFTLTDVFYTRLTQSLLVALPPCGALPTSCGCPSLTRASHAQRRMWMLGRKANGEPHCPALPPVQRALLLVAGLNDAAPGAKQLRTEEAAEALLGMLRCVLPAERPALSSDCAFVGEAAARVLFYELQNIILPVKAGS